MTPNMTQGNLGPAQTCPVHNGRDSPFEIVFMTPKVLYPTISKGVVVVFFSHPKIVPFT
jgi:hypothetical protein